MSHTVRTCVSDAMGLIKAGGTVHAVGKLHQALNLLDESREVTEKVTQGWTSAEGPHPTKGFKVTSHKARVVLDD